MGQFPINCSLDFQSQFSFLGKFFWDYPLQSSIFGELVITQHGFHKNGPFTILPAHPVDQQSPKFINILLQFSIKTTNLTHQYDAKNKEKRVVLNWPLTIIVNM